MCLFPETRSTSGVCERRIDLMYKIRDQTAHFPAHFLFPFLCPVDDLIQLPDLVLKFPQRRFFFHSKELLFLPVDQVLDTCVDAVHRPVDRSSDRPISAAEYAQIPDPVAGTGTYPHKRRFFDQFST